MAENSRIDDLRKRYHENPRRFFAPLANEYRKTGFVDRALLLCEKHLGEQPDNMNGLVVYGQALFESGRHEDARQPFERALALDPENLIALRHLGDIARLGGDVATAKGWYVRVLEFDRRNDEVLDLLQQMGADDSPTEESASSNAAAGLVSASHNVSVSGGDMMDLGMVDISEPEPPEAPMPAALPPAAKKLSIPKVASGPGSTVVINAQALANADRREAESAPPPKRASLFDIDFDFSEMPDADAAPAKPAAPVMGAEAAEYGFADVGVSDSLADAAGADTLIVEPSQSSVPMAAETPAPPAGDFELAEFSADVSPLAGFEASEFSAEAATDAAPLAGLDEPDSTPSAVPRLADLDEPGSMPSVVPPLAGLDFPDFGSDASEPAADEAATADPLAGLPSFDDEPIVEPASAGPPRPRMTKSDMASIPLLADYGLEEDDNTTEPRRAQPTPTFVTETMAELYITQGFRAEAVAVYQQLILQSPDDAGLRARLAALQASDEGAPEFDVPSPDAVEPEPAPANAVLADVSFAGVGLRTPGSATPVITPAANAGPTAREFFSSFARRAAVATATVAAVASAEPAAAAVDAAPAPEVAATTSGWPLDALFGAANEVRDLHAAETLAGIATFEGPDGGTGLGPLLSDAPAPRRSVPRASQSLKFDQFFSTPGSPSAPAADGPADDDLDQFQGWLKGLKT